MLLYFTCYLINVYRNMYIFALFFSFAHMQIVHLNKYETFFIDNKNFYVQISIIYLFQIFSGRTRNFAGSMFTGICQFCVHNVLARILLHSGVCFSSTCNILFCICEISYLFFFLFLLIIIWQDWQDSDTVGLTTYFLLFVSFCFNMYILCYIGELLMEKVCKSFLTLLSDGFFASMKYNKKFFSFFRILFQSSYIGSICFMIDWYQLPAKTVRSLVLVIAMSSHPIKISAGRMIDLSLATFGNVRNAILHFRDVYMKLFFRDVFLSEINRYQNNLLANASLYVLCTHTFFVCEET